MARTSLLDFGVSGGGVYATFRTGVTELLPTVWLGVPGVLGAMAPSLIVGVGLMKQGAHYTRNAIVCRGSYSCPFKSCVTPE